MVSNTGARDEPEDAKDGPTVDRFRKKLSASGGGGGVSLHFDAGFAAEYHLDSGTEVDVQVVEENGDVSFRIGNIPAGFTYDDLKELGEKQNWETTDEYASEDEDEWYLTYRNEQGNVRVQIDSESQVNGSTVNNVVIQGDPMDVTDDMDLYNRLCAMAQRKELRVRVSDSKGLWQQLRASVDYDTDDAPSEEAFGQLSNAAEEVSARLICQRTSLKTTVGDLKQIVGRIETAYEELDDS